MPQLRHLAANPLTQKRFLRFASVRWPKPDRDRRLAVSIGQCSGSDLERDIEIALKTKDAVSRCRQLLGNGSWDQEQAGKLVTPLLLCFGPSANSTWPLPLLSLIKKSVPKLMANAKAQSVPGGCLAERRGNLTPSVGWLRVDPQVEKVATRIRAEFCLHVARRADPLAGDVTTEGLGQAEDVQSATSCREFSPQRKRCLFRGLNQYRSNIEDTPST